MTDDQFAKLFNYIQGVDKKVDTVIENMATKDDIRALASVIGGNTAENRSS